MRHLGTLALVLATVASGPAPFMRLATSSGSHADITFDGTRLTVPQHCREEDCNASSQRIDRLEQALAAQGAENAALRKLITALASRVTANEVAHNADAKDLLDAKAAYEAADDALQQQVSKVTKMAGPTGPKGDKGDKGDQGDTGDRGDQGARGAPGKDGATGAEARCSPPQALARR